MYPAQNYKSRMPCPICGSMPGSGVDHRLCLVELFKTNQIQSVKEWEEMSRKPKTIIKGKAIRIVRLD